MIFIYLNGLIEIMNEHNIYKFSEKDYEQFSEDYSLALKLLTSCKDTLNQKCPITFQIEINGINEKIESLFNYFYDISKYNKI